MQLHLATSGGIVAHEDGEGLAAEGREIVGVGVTELQGSVSRLARSNRAVVGAWISNQSQAVVHCSNAIFCPAKDLECAGLGELVGFNCGGRISRNVG